MSKKGDIRRDAIMAKLYAESAVSVHDLSAEFQVSEETIRQDLTRLSSLGLCSRVHGGASVRQYAQVDVDVKASEHAQEKNRIARAAVSLIPDGAAVWIGPGTTLSAMARYLPLRKDLLIVTNSLDLAAMARSTRHEIIFVGGRIQKFGGCAVGMYALENLSHIRIDLAFVGCDGFVEGEGPTTFSFEEMEIHRRVMSLAPKKVLVCDASKFQHAGTFIFARYADFSSFITTGMRPDQRKLVAEIPEIIEA